MHQLMGERGWEGCLGRSLIEECHKNHLQRRPFLYSSSILFEEKDCGLEGGKLRGIGGQLRVQNGGTNLHEIPCKILQPSSLHRLQNWAWKVKETARLSWNWSSQPPDCLGTDQVNRQTVLELIKSTVRLSWNWSSQPPDCLGTDQVSRQTVLELIKSTARLSWNWSSQPSDCLGTDQVWNRQAVMWFCSSLKPPDCLGTDQV